MDDAMNIIQVASSNSDFSILVDALVKANLVSVLEGTGPFTVFAPTNDAFAALLIDLGVTSLDDISADALRPILLNHVVSCKFLSSDLSTGYVSTANASGPDNSSVSLFIEVMSGVQINSDVSVVTADLPASNGVIHVIDKVILPTTVVDIAVQNDNFTSLVGALTAADGDLVSVLNGTGPFTVFAPVNSAFDAIAGVVAGLSAEDLAGVLTYHVVSGNIKSSDLTNGMIVNTLNGTFTVDLSGSTPMIQDAAGNTVNIIATDVQGTNGIVHVIDGVLLK
jgi:transforming growth factor-beta-induced protein